jgi:hypothetical protein
MKESILSNKWQILGLVFVIFVVTVVCLLQETKTNSKPCGKYKRSLSVTIRGLVVPPDWLPAWLSRNCIYRLS